MSIGLTLCTSNDGKRREFERILGIPLTTAPIDLAEIQSIDAGQVCRAKAALAYELLKAPVLVDDTGFELAGLGGFPGALVTWALEAGGVEILHRMLPRGGPADAAAITCIGLADERGVHVFSGRIAGTVLAEPRGTKGFGFDPVFVPQGATKSYAEMDDSEKDGCSPRGVALEKLAMHIRARAQS
jgi:XTP/dITP diphosphohydrolase